MEIHRPKPWHGWREFLKEYLIIVVGVLTALAAEQVVEVIHRRELVGEARRALNSEATFDLTVFQVTAFQVACINQRLDEVERWARSAGGGHASMGSPPALPAPKTTNFRTSVWRVASAGALVQMPFEDRVAFGHLYDSFENNANVRREAWHELWYDIDQFMGAHHLEEREQQRIASDIRRIRLANAALLHNWEGVSESARAMGLQPDPHAKASMDELASSPLCKPFGA